MALDTKNHRAGCCRTAIVGALVDTRSQGLNIEYLTVAIVSAFGTGDVRGHFTAALRAVLELRSRPAIGATALFLPAFGSTSLGNSHDEMCV